MTDDPITDAERLLTGTAIDEVLRVATSAAGGQLLSRRTVHVDRRRGQVTASYRARVRWRGVSVPRDETFGAVTGEPLPAGVSVVEDGRTRVGVWRVPFDPWLPGLAVAMDTDAVTGLLADFGVAGARPRLRLRSYRPGRRAVVEVHAGPARMFLKVVRADRAHGLHERHRLAAEAGVPVPLSLGWTDSGVVALTALPGRTLRENLGRADHQWPPLRALSELLDRLPDELVGLGGAAPDRDRHHADRVGSICPDVATRAAELAETISAERVTGATVPVHGDFYERQILTRGPDVLGLLDLDTAGPGDRLDDVGCLVGHLSVLALARPARADLIGRVVRDYLADLDRTVDPRQLRLRIAATVLSLAVGPYRVQEPGWPRLVRERLALAEHWTGTGPEPVPTAGPRTSGPHGSGSTPIDDRHHHHQQ